MARDLRDRKVGAQNHHFVYTYTSRALQHLCMRPAFLHHKKLQVYPPWGFEVINLINK